MHHPTDRITHTTAFVTPVLEHWLVREIAQWVHLMKERSDDPSHHERTLLPRSYISLHYDVQIPLQCSVLNRLFYFHLCSESVTLVWYIPDFLISTSTPAFQNSVSMNPYRFILPDCSTGKTETTHLKKK